MLFVRVFGTMLINLPWDVEDAVPCSAEPVSATAPVSDKRLPPATIAAAAK